MKFLSTAILFGYGCYLLATQSFIAMAFRFRPHPALVATPVSSLAMVRNNKNQNFFQVKLQNFWAPFQDQFESTTRTRAATTMNAVPSTENNDEDFVDLVVGGYPYRTTRDVLLSSPHASGDGNTTYFHALLSEEGIATADGPFEIPEVDGRLFFYVLYFLQVGEIPRDIKNHWRAHESLLPREDVNKLEQLARYFGLAKLADLCKVAGGVGRYVGDLDLAPFSGVRFDSSEIGYDHKNSEFYYSDFELRYTYNDTTNIEVVGLNQIPNLLGRYRLQVSAKNKDRSTSYYRKDITSEDVVLVDNDIFERTWERIKEVIFEDLLPQDEDERFRLLFCNVSVTEVLDRCDIVPEVRLWYAFLIHWILNPEQEVQWYVEDYDAMAFLFRESCFSRDESEQLSLKDIR